MHGKHKGDAYSHPCGVCWSDIATFIGCWPWAPISQNVVNRERQLSVSLQSTLGVTPTNRSTVASITPTGRIEKRGPLNAYISSPTSDPLGTLLLLPDGFGLVQHNFILADQFAANGWHVIMPDYYEGMEFF